MDKICYKTKVGFTHSGGFRLLNVSLLSAIFLSVAVDFALIAGFRGQSVFLIHLCVHWQVLPFVKPHS